MSSNIEETSKKRERDEEEDAQAEDPPSKLAKVVEAPENDENGNKSNSNASTFDCGTPEGCPNHEKGEEKKLDTASSAASDQSNSEEVGNRGTEASQTGAATNDPEEGNRDVVKQETEEPLGIVIDREGEVPVKEEDPAESLDTEEPPIEQPPSTSMKSEQVDPPAPTDAQESSASAPGLPPGVPGFAGQESYHSPEQASAGVDPNVQATLTNPEALVEESEEISPLYVGKVIGKGGEMIRDLQARSNCSIDVDQSVPPGQPRVITYKGTRQSVDFARSLVRMLSQEGVSEADLPLGAASREFLIIPAQSVGKVIGRGGEMIRELQSRSSAKIQVDHSGVSGLPQDKKQVTITGKEQAVAKAKEMVMFLVANPAMDALQSLNLLVEEKLRGGSVWGSGPPYPNLPNQGYDMRPEMFPPPAAAYGAPGFPAPPMAYAAPPAVVPYQPVQPAFGQYSAPSGQSENDVFYAPKQYMGRIIGQRGVTVNDLQRRSGCDIQINQNVAQGQECEISIRGPRQGIESAKQMIREIIEIGPGHPYAGGAEARPGGHYGGGGGGGYQQQGYDYGQAYGGFQQGFVQPAAYGQPAYGFEQQQAYGYVPPLAVPPPALLQPPVVVSAWKSATAPDGQVYYYNENTGETTWEKPPGFM